MTKDLGDHSRATPAGIGADGVNDIFVIDVSNGLGPADVLQNWTPGEDLIAIVDSSSQSIQALEAPSRAGLALAMAIHELAGNAAKYGACPRPAAVLP